MNWKYQAGFFVLLSCLVLFIVSCSIEKRHYRPGFYFDRKNSSSSEIKPVFAETKKGSFTSALADKQNKDSVLQEANTAYPEVNEPGGPEKVNYSTGEVKTYLEKDFPASPKQIPPDDPDTPEKKKNRLAVLAFEFGLIGVLCLLTLFFFGWAIAFLAILFNITSFVLGLLALRQFRESPGAFTNKWMAWFGVAAGAVVILFFILLVGSFIYYFFIA